MPSRTSRSSCAPGSGSPRSASSARWSNSGMSPCPSSAAEASSRGGAASSTRFPAGQPLPVRIEWFGDEIDSLRAFDPDDQRGVGKVGQTVLLPASEFLLPAGGSESSARLGQCGVRLPENLAADLAGLDSGALGDAAEIWPATWRPATALDHTRRGDLGSSTRPGGLARRSPTFLWARRTSAVPSSRRPANYCRRAGPRHTPRDRRDWRAPSPRGTHPWS